MNNNEIGDIGKHLDVVRKRIDMLKEIQTQHDELETKFFEEKAALEAKYQKLYQPLYAKRYDIVNGVVDVEESIAGENPTDEKGVPDFWLNAMKNNEVLAEEISGSDKEALKFLKDIKWSKGDNPKVFNLEFCFDTNPFFKNTVLTKTYQVIDEEDGPILERAIGTEIEWLPEKSLTQKIVKKKPKKGSKNVKPYTITEKCESFFNFFSPLQVPGADMDDDEAEDLRNLMEQDFDIGSTIRDEIIPHAVSWFTGEAAGYEYDDMEEDEEEDPVDEDEEDEEEDEEDDDDEDESTTEKKLSAGNRGPAVDGQQGEQPPECKQQ